MLGLSLNLDQRVRTGFPCRRTKRFAEKCSECSEEDENSTIRTTTRISQCRREEVLFHRPASTLNCGFCINRSLTSPTSREASLLAVWLSTNCCMANSRWELCDEHADKGSLIEEIDPAMSSIRDESDPETFSTRDAPRPRPQPALTTGQSRSKKPRPPPSATQRETRTPRWLRQLRHGEARPPIDPQDRGPKPRTSPPGPPSRSTARNSQQQDEFDNSSSTLPTKRKSTSLYPTWDLYR